MGMLELPSGLVIEERAIRPTTPNGNLPAENPPATVGADTYTPGDPNGLVLVDEGPGSPFPRSRITPSPWSGWPAEWITPAWGHLSTLTDTAWTALDLNSSIMSVMPPYLVNASPNLPTDWLNNPDPDKYTSWEEFFKALAWDYQLGEAFVIATARYSNTYPARFHVVPPWTVNAEIVGGRRRYSIGGVDVTDDVLHLRYQSRVDDAHGHGPLEVGRTRLIAAKMLSDYGTNLAATGAIPNAILSSEDELNETQSRALQTQWVEARMNSMGLPAVLSGGITFEALQFSPKDLGLVDLLQFQESRIAVLLGVPPFLLALPSSGDPLTYSTVSQTFDYHWRAGLRPKAQAITSALSQWLTPRGTTLELNRDSYVAPDPLTRAQTWEILIRIGVVTAEQAQAWERYSNNITPEGTVLGAPA